MATPLSGPGATTALPKRGKDGKMYTPETIGTAEEREEKRRLEEEEARKARGLLEKSAKPDAANPPGGTPAAPGAPAEPGTPVLEGPPAPNPAPGNPPPVAQGGNPGAGGGTRYGEGVTDNIDMNGAIVDRAYGPLLEARKRFAERLDSGEMSFEDSVKEAGRLGISAGALLRRSGAASPDKLPDGGRRQLAGDLLRKAAPEPGAPGAANPPSPAAKPVATDAVAERLAETRGLLGKERPDLEGPPSSAKNPDLSTSPKPYEMDVPPPAAEGLSFFRGPRTTEVEGPPSSLAYKGAFDPRYLPDKPNPAWSTDTRVAYDAFKRKQDPYGARFNRAVVQPVVGAARGARDAVLGFRDRTRAWADRVRVATGALDPEDPAAIRARAMLERNVRGQAKR